MPEHKPLTDKELDILEELWNSDPAWAKDSLLVLRDLRALREAAEPFAQMARLVGLEYGDEEWVVWIRGKDEKGEMREAGLQWLDLRCLAELREGK